MYKHRLKIILTCVAVMLLILVVRMWQLQIVQGADYRQAARDMLDRSRWPGAVRGQITDRNGLFLAMNEVTYDFCLHYRFLTQDPEWIESQQRQIARTQRVSEERAREIYQRREANTWRIAEALAAREGADLPASVQRVIRRVRLIRRQVGGDVAEQFQVHPVVAGLARPIYIDMESTIGAEVVPSLKRRYPHGEAACHIIGWMGQVTDAEREYMTDVPPGSDVGKRGIERMCEELLRGQRGYQRTERVDGREMVLENEPAEPGRDIHLTIDINLQSDIEQLFRRMAGMRNGSAVVLSVQTGEVLAMVSIPTYDLNTVRRHYADLSGDQAELPLLSRAVTRYYPPGSIAKPVTALAGLTYGTIDLNTIYTCRGYLHTPEAFRCWIYSRGGSHGPLDVQGAIKNSCNVFFYNVGQGLGLDREREWFGRFGFGERPGTGLPEEMPGAVAVGEHPVGPGMSRLLAIGQGPFDATPLQCANAMATIARGGVFLSPIIALEGAPSQLRRDLGIAPEHMSVVQKGLYEVCNSPGGTAYRPFHLGSPQDTEFRPLEVVVAGKTGTAQVAPQRVDSNEDGVINSDDEIIRRGDMAWFTGFAPWDEPQIAVAVVVEYVTDGGGSTYAAPIGREIIRLCRQYGYVR